jgi:enoyl-CoA hydratase/carnithine racemase
VGGADIAELCARDRHDALRFINNGLLRSIEKLQAPTIAAVRGFALGGGCELALACDIRICGAGARFGQPEVSLGIIPGAGATYRLMRAVGPGMARELIFTGRVILAEEALRIGLVNRVVADEQVLGAARGLATEIIKNSALAVRFAKLCANAVTEMSVDACMTLEATAQAVLFEDADKKARMTAFLERKKATKKSGA